MLANGVSLLNAVEVASGTLANQVLAKKIRAVDMPLARGEGLAGPLRKSDVFPPLAIKLIEVGEESGHLENMLQRVAVIYDEEVRRKIQRLLALLVPGVTIVLGALVAVVIGSLLAAILSIYDIAV